jgi:MOSC domain-containing protein YiiM
LELLVLHLRYLNGYLDDNFQKVSPITKIKSSIILLIKHFIMTNEEMRNTFFQEGKVEYISIRPFPKARVVPLERVEANEENGLTGDHYQGNSGNRQVTLIQKEHIQAVALLLARKEIDPALLRRNIVVSGINLLAFEGKRIQVGGTVLEMTTYCEPCSQMEANLGSGGYTAMVGHGGICARVISGGIIKIGDVVKPFEG